MRIDFKGYSHRHDEWKDYTVPGIVSTNFPIVKLEKLEKPSSETLGERTRILLSTLRLEIKRRLLSTRRDDPDVRLELPIDEAVFCEAFGRLRTLLRLRGRTIHKIRQNSELDKTLGTRWQVRMKNEMGDFEQVKNGSVEFWLNERPPLNDFAPARGKLFPCKLEQGPVLVFTFVRDTGNLRKYLERFPM